MTWLAGSATARAYCRTTTAKLTQSSCPEPCVTEGLPLFWESPYVRYAFDERGFPGFDDDALRAVFERAFDAWEDVRCGEQQVGLRVWAEPRKIRDGVGPESAKPAWNVNTVVHFTADEWRERDLPSSAFAVTGVWFNPSSGRIVGADMQFNGGMDPFGVCPEDGCDPADTTTDLLNVATHEAGHFVGLAHSDEPESTMWCGAETGEVEKRDLAEDDMAGLCAAYPPEQAFRNADPAVRSIGCALHPAPSTDRALAFGLPLLALWLGRARRARAALTRPARRVGVR